MKNKEFDVVGMGSCIMDTIAFVSKFTECEEKINAIRYFPPRAAGVALDAITQLVHLGLKCGFIGKHGDDDLGRQFIRELTDDSIDITSVRKVKGELTSLAWIQVKPDGERCHVIMPMGAKGMLNEEDAFLAEDMIKNTSVLHLELLQDPVKPFIRAAEMAKKSGAVVSVDLDVAPRYLIANKLTSWKELKSLFSLADVLKACKNAVSDLSRADELENAVLDILEYGPGIAIITTGEKGCIIGSVKDGKKESVLVPAFSGGKIQDTTGAGDAFQGGFLYGLLKNWPLVRCGEFANACGYLKSKNIGARNPGDIDTIRNFLSLNGWENAL